MSHENIMQPGLQRPKTQNSILSRIVFAVFRRVVRRMGQGRVVLTLPNDQTASFNLATPGPVADLQVRSSAVLWKSLRNGPLGFAESYLDGTLETSNLADIFRFVLRNRHSVSSSARQLFRARFPDRLRHLLRRNSRQGSRDNIAHHYDLGNAFYELWLDRSMTYSSGYFLSPEQTLEDAQCEKNAQIIKQLEIEPGHSILEIGCGWGGFAEAAAQNGATVAAVTISKEQHAYARKRIGDAALQDRCDIRFEDYRDITGQHDRVVSIEMVEAVGRENWPTYFKTIHDRLVPGGIAVLQAITIDDDLYDRYLRQPDFIQRFIFPGGMLPTSNLIREQAVQAGLVPVRVELFGDDYAKTLWAWRDNFMAQWPLIEKLGFDERFRRMWDYYLTYCAVGFEEGSVDVGFYKFVKPDL